MSSPLLTATPRPEQFEGYYRLLRREPASGHDGADPERDEQLEQQFFVEWEVPQAT